MPPRASEETSQSVRRRPLRLPFWAGITAVGVVAVGGAVAIVGPRLGLHETECTAIGYSSLLVVTLTGDGSPATQVQVRDGDAWQPPFPSGPDATPPAIPTSRDGDTWTFTLFSPANPVALRALDDEGGVLAHTERDIRWVRVGGTEGCGGPTEGHVDWDL